MSGAVSLSPTVTVAPKLPPEKNRPTPTLHHHGSA